MIDVVDWAESPQGFYTDRRWVDGEWVMGPAPIVLAEYHRRILRHVFTPGSDGRLPYDIISWCEPAKSGKSAIAGLAAEYVALHAERNSSVVMASNAQRQAASVMFASAADSVNANPFLPKVNPNRTEITFANGNKIEAIPSASRTAAGARFVLAVFDELWGYVHQDAERLWSEFKTDPTRIMSTKMAIGYAGYTESELWLGLLQKGLQGEPVAELADIEDGDGQPACWANQRHFTFWSHQCRQPWQTEAWVDGLRRDLRPNEFARMVECRFVEGEGSFIDQADWESLIDPDLQRLEPGDKSVDVAIGLDLALSPRGDDCALIGVYRASGRTADTVSKSDEVSRTDTRVAVAFHKVWSGKTRIRRLKLGTTVKPWILQAASDYKLTGVYFDPWQAQHLADELNAAGVRCHAVPQTRSTRGAKDTTLWELASTGRLALYDDPELRRMAAGANATELGDGRLFLRKASGRSKIDLLIALSNVADEIASEPGVVQHFPNPWIDPMGFAEHVGIGWDPDAEQFITKPATVGVAAHSDSPAHRKYSKKHFCYECHQEFRESGAYDRWNKL